jgi:hypothetical protein
VLAVRALEQLFNLDEYKRRPKWYEKLTVEDDGLIGNADYHFDLLYDDNLSWVRTHLPLYLSENGNLFTLAQFLNLRTSR